MIFNLRLWHLRLQYLTSYLYAIHNNRTYLSLLHLWSICINVETIGLKSNSTQAYPQVLIYHLELVPHESSSRVVSCYSYHWTEHHIRICMHRASFEGEHLSDVASAWRIQQILCHSQGIDTSSVHLGGGQLQCGPPVCCTCLHSEDTPSSLHAFSCDPSGVLQFWTYCHMYHIQTFSPPLHAYICDVASLWTSSWNFCHKHYKYMRASHINDHQTHPMRIFHCILHTSFALVSCFSFFYTIKENLIKSQWNSGVNNLELFPVVTT